MIDLRSDTVTKPSQGMKKAMYDAELGDDCYGDDPTINKLEYEMALLLGKDKAVFMTSGTQSNLSAVLSHCGRGEEMIAGFPYHMAQDEAAGASVLGGVAMTTIAVGNDGAIPEGAIKKAVKPDDLHCPISKLICIENTSSGKAIEIQKLKKNFKEAKELDLNVHLDGARFFNAVESLNCNPKDLADCADSVSICFSKGLGAPAGSILCFTEDMEKKVRRQRKILGGALRQAGVIGAACRYALKNNIERLKEDRERAQYLAKALNQYHTKAGVKDLENQTNMVFFEPLENQGKDLVSFLKQRGIIISKPQPQTRLVMHLDISDKILDFFIKSIDEFYAS